MGGGRGGDKQTMSVFNRGYVCKGCVSIRPYVYVEGGGLKQTMGVWVCMGVKNRLRGERERLARTFCDHPHESLSPQHLGMQQVPLPIHRQVCYVRYIVR